MLVGFGSLFFDETSVVVFCCCLLVVVVLFEGFRINRYQRR